MDDAHEYVCAKAIANCTRCVPVATCDSVHGHVARYGTLKWKVTVSHWPTGAHGAPVTIGTNCSKTVCPTSVHIVSTGTTVRGPSPEAAVQLTSCPNCPVNDATRLYASVARPVLDPDSLHERQLRVSCVHMDKSAVPTVTTEAHLDISMPGV